MNFQYQLIAMSQIKEHVKNTYGLDVLGVYDWGKEYGFSMESVSNKGQMFLMDENSPEIPVATIKFVFKNQLVKYEVCKDIKKYEKVRIGYKGEAVKTFETDALDFSILFETLSQILPKLEETTNI